MRLVPASQNRGKRHKTPKRTQRLGTLGLIVIVILMLALTITRSWHLIAWRAR